MTELFIGFIAGTGFGALAVYGWVVLVVMPHRDKRKP